MYGDSIDNSDAGNPAIVTKPVSQQPPQIPFLAGGFAFRQWLAVKAQAVVRSDYANRDRATQVEAS